MALKGLAKDHELCSAIDDRAPHRLLDMFENNAEVDPDIMLPVVKTLDLLRDLEDNPPMKMLGPKYMATVLQNHRAL